MSTTVGSCCIPLILDSGWAEDWVKAVLGIRDILMRIRGSGSPDQYLRLMDPTPFFIDFKDTKKKNLIFFSFNLPTGTSSLV